MEFGEKLKELRKARGLTQEELAVLLYVSRTAVSKWEAGRGTPNIESLKAVAKIFSVMVDDLLSTDEALRIAEREHRQRQGRFCDAVCGLLDISVLMLLFLPFFAAKMGGEIQSVSLWSAGVQRYLKILYAVGVIAMGALGAVTLLFAPSEAPVWVRVKTLLSLSFSAALVALFMLSLQPYAGIFVFFLLAIKAFLQNMKKRG